MLPACRRRVTRRGSESRPVHPVVGERRDARRRPGTSPPAAGAARAHLHSGCARWQPGRTSTSDGPTRSPAHGSRYGSAHAHGPGGEPPRRFDLCCSALSRFHAARHSSTDSRLPPTAVLILNSKFRQSFVFRCPCSAPRRLWRLDFLSSYDCFIAWRSSSTSRRRYSSGSCSRDRRGRRHS